MRESPRYVLRRVAMNAHEMFSDKQGSGMHYQCLQHPSLTLGTTTDVLIGYTIGKQYKHSHAFPQKKHVCVYAFNVDMCIIYIHVCVYLYMHTHILVSMMLNSSQKGKQPIKAV